MKRFDSGRCWVRFSQLALFAVIFLLSVSAVYAAGGGEEEGGMWKDFAWRMLNFAVLIGFLYWLMANKIKEFFVGRRADINAALEDARRAKAEAEQKYREYEEKLTKATGEIDGIVDMIKSQGLVERDKILEDAKKAAEKLKEDTKTRMDQELTNAKSQLRAEAVQLSVQMAEEILKRSITPADHENMVKDYLDKVVIKH